MDAPEKQPVPWQKRKESGLIKALLLTIKQVLFRPGRFFADLEVEKSFFPPLLFAWILSFIGMVFITLFGLLSKKGVTLPQAVVALILTPILAVILPTAALFIGTGAMHLFVMLFGGKGGFKGTFNVLAYQSAVSVFSAVPFVGMLIAWVWGIVIGVSGFKHVHKFSTARAFFAYFTPTFIFGIVGILGLLAAIAIPNLLRARITSNDSAAKASVEMIAAAAEAYAADNNGEYPSAEYDLKYGTHPYLDTIYNNKTIQGYVYSSKLSSGGYKIAATPSECGVTGKNIFTIETKGGISERPCKRQP
ncbi:MAG: Yip1 family protein [Candidatus Omnitrophota bacterium]